MKKVLLILILSIKIDQFWCSACKKTYAVKCETVADYETYTGSKSTEVIIESTYSTNTEKTTVRLSLFRDVSSLTIVGQINDLGANSYSTDSSALKIVNLYDNNIKALKKGSFPYFSRIYQLILAKNRIASIEAETFTHCQPEIIDLSNNKIEVIESRTFTNSWSENTTKAIILENNRLVNVEKHSFPPSLTLLNLKRNKLSYIDPRVFRNLDRLELLVLSKNKFSTVPDLTSLSNVRTIDLSYNRIDSLHATSFGVKTNLDRLDLSHNRISEISNGTFSSFRNLHSLDLSYNKIQQVEFLHAFYGTYIEISLAFNLLKNLQFGREPWYSASLSLYGNPWICGDWMSIEKYLLEMEVRRNSCDLKLFGGGNAPFCYCVFPDKSLCKSMSYEYAGIPYTGVSGEDLRREKFLKLAKKRKLSEDCQFVYKQKSYGIEFYNTWKLPIIVH